MEVLSNGYSLNEVAHIANGSHPGNCISLLRINVSTRSIHIYDKKCSYTFIIALSLY